MFEYFATFPSHSQMVHSQYIFFNPFCVMKYPINSFTLLLFSPSLISQSVCFSFSLWSLHTFRLFFSFWVFSFAFSFTCSHVFFYLFIYSWFFSNKHTHTQSLSLWRTEASVCELTGGGFKGLGQIAGLSGSQSLWKIHRSSQPLRIIVSLTLLWISGVSDRQSDVPVKAADTAAMVKLSGSCQIRLGWE